MIFAHRAEIHREGSVNDFPWGTLQQIAPDQVRDIVCRAMVMDHVGTTAPIGRRMLSGYLGLPEREVRAAADALRDEGLLIYQPTGMMLSPEGQAMLPQVRALCRAFSGANDLEAQLSRALGIEHVTVVPGDADASRGVLRECGRAAAQRLRQMVKGGMTVAISGGSTMYELARLMTPGPANVMVVPARGGFGTSTAIQADSVAEELARNMKATCKLCHLPDGLNAHALEEMQKLPDIAETIRLMRSADIVVHGIGRADEMSRRRGMTARQQEELAALGAQGEALGDFFDEQGAIVQSNPSVSTELRTRNPGARTLWAAAGSRKAMAILAAARHQPPHSLVIDEAAARQMIKHLT
jgi:central glycolytic genes regulator